MQKEEFVAFGKVLDLLLDAICVVNRDGKVVYISAACERIFGYSAKELTGTSLMDLLHPGDLEPTLRAAADVMSGHPLMNFENRYVRKDGKIVHVTWSTNWSEADQLRVAVVRDITEQKRLQAMQLSLHRISEAAHAADDLLDLYRLIHEIIGELLPARNFFVAIYDKDKDELSFPYFEDELDEAPIPMALDSGTFSGEVIRSGQPLLFRSDAPIQLPDTIGPLVGSNPLDWLGVPLRSSKGVVGAIVVQSYSGGVRYSEADQSLLQFVSNQIAAVIERKKSENRLRYVSRHDALTGLPNREWFDACLQSTLERHSRDGGRLALLYMDLDTFKEANDNFGHLAGDMLLREVANRIGRCIRETDTAGRVGGDEIAVLLDPVRTPEDASIVAEKIRNVLVDPFTIDGAQIRISASIGIAVYPDHGDDSDTLLRRADGAMYLAKKSGGNCCQMVRD